jgi:hypothetical protein
MSEFWLEFPSVAVEKKISFLVCVIETCFGKPSIRAVIHLFFPQSQKKCFRRLLTTYSFDNFTLDFMFKNPGIIDIIKSMLNYWQRLEYLDSFPILQSAYKHSKKLYINNKSSWFSSLQKVFLSSKFLINFKYFSHYGFHSFPVVDWFCLFIYLWVLTFLL